MSSPVQIPDLPSAGIIDAANDLTIVRQGFTDKKATIAQIRDFDVSLFPTLPSSAVVSDLFPISRGGNNYQIRFDQVSFVAGTQLWFYQNVAPSGWVVIPVGDCLLAVKGGSTYNVGGALPQGTWQQTGMQLNIQQIPNHTHHYYFGSDQSNENSRFAHGAKNQRPRLGITQGVDGSSQAVGGVGAPHDHGASWRPLAATGILCQKQP